jgi:hypothetical protein
MRTPALTVPQVRLLIAGLLNQVLQSHRQSHRPMHFRRTLQRRLRRNEEARLYHWQQRNRLPPRRVEQRPKQAQKN